MFTKNVILSSIFWKPIIAAPTAAPFDWHNGPHGDIILTQSQKESLDEIGFDTSDYRIDEHAIDQKGLKADGTFTKWNQLNAEGKIIVPYYLEDTVTAEHHQQVHDELVDFSFSVGCIEFVHDPDLTNDRGVYVIGQDSVMADGTTEDRCWSYVGMCYSCGRNDYPTVKIGWQALRLPDWCVLQGQG